MFQQYRLCYSKGNKTGRKCAVLSQRFCIFLVQSKSNKEKMHPFGEIIQKSGSQSRHLYTDTKLVICLDLFTLHKVNGDIILYPCRSSQVADKVCLLLALSSGGKKKRFYNEWFWNQQKNKPGKVFYFHMEPWEFCPSVSKQKSKLCFYTFSSIIVLTSLMWIVPLN